jgi:hypothetical protein
VEEEEGTEEEESCALNHLRIMHWDTDRRPRRGLRHSIFYEISDNLVERAVVISSGSRMR